MNRTQSTTKSKKVSKTRQELNEEGRERKRQKKHKGNTAGARFNVESSTKKSAQQKVEKDLRIGSKVPVALTTDITKVAKPAKVKLTPAQELELLESNERLDGLLMRLEDGETLSQTDQAYVDKTLDRIDELMVLLGIDLDDDETDEEEKEQDILQLLKRN